MADFTPAGEVPGVGEALALLRLGSLDTAAPIHQHAAGVIWVLQNREPITRGVNAGMLLDKLLLCKFEEGGDLSDLCICNTHITRPAAARCAAVALVKGSRV